jgi:hypothetical protein
MDFAGSRARLTALSAGLLMAAAASARSVDTPLGRAGPPQVQARSGPGSVRETGLFLRPDALRSLRDARAGEEIVVRGFPLDDAISPDLELQRFELYSPSAEIVEFGPGGETRVPAPEAVFFEGRIAGDPESRVFLSAFGASLHGYVQRGEETFAIAPAGGWDRETPEHFVRKLTREEWAALAASWRCDAELRPPAPSREAMLATAVADTGQPYTATISVDTDYELYRVSFSGNVTAERNYVSNELAAVSAIYWRDLKTRLQVGFLRVWTTQADPWSATTPLASLYEVGDYWHAHATGGSRSAVVFLSGKNTGGGVSWVGTLCEGDFWDSVDGHWGGAYAVVGNISGTVTNFQHPAAGSDVWDIEAIAHELGHTFGSVHTHCYAPPIDECYGNEPGCYSGPAVDPGPGVGTIMSYCHFFGWSEISLRFHSRCITEQMRPTIIDAASASPSCMAAAGFTDVSPNDVAAPAIATIAAWGITAGCGPQIFCPTANVTRAQMAIFIERALGTYAPLPGPQLFTDVAPGSFGYDFIGDFARRGITSGCTPSAYCPSAGVTRAQMAVFLLRAEHGSSYSPPSATGTMFSDVPAKSFTAPWIEQLARESITGGCGNGKFCPNDSVPRGQMAIFLVRTFHL